MDGEPTHFRKTSKNIVGQCCSNMFKSMIVQPLLGMIHPYSSQESGDQTSSNISESTNQPYETGPNSIKHLAFRPPSLVVVFEHLRPPLTPNSSSCIHSFEIHSIHELWPNLGVEHPPELASWPKTCFFFQVLNTRTTVVGQKPWCTTPLNLESQNWFQGKLTGILFGNHGVQPKKTGFPVDVPLKHIRNSETGVSVLQKIRTVSYGTCFFNVFWAFVLCHYVSFSKVLCKVQVCLCVPYVATGYGSWHRASLVDHGK